MIPRVSLVRGGIFGFAEIRGFSLFGLYLHETAQCVRSSANRYTVNGVRKREQHFAVL